LPVVTLKLDGDGLGEGEGVLEFPQPAFTKQARSASGNPRGGMNHT
jgi:hypothetical protein